MPPQVTMSFNKLYYGRNVLFPTDWPLATIGDVTIVSSGSTPSRRMQEFFKGDIPWVTSGELNYNIITTTNEHITTDAVRLTNLKILPKGTFLMAITGLEAIGTRGRCGILGINATTNQSCMAIQKSKKLDTLFLLYYYIYLGERIISFLAQGTKQQSLNLSIVKSIKIYLPPIQEQQKIASILSKADELIQKTELIIEQILKLKKGIMQRLLTKGIRHTKFKKTKLGDIPTSWNIVSLNEICKNITDGKHGDCENEYNSGYYFVSAKDIFGGKIRYENARQITKSDFLDSHKRTKIELGDILLTNSGTIGKLAIVADISKTTRTTFQKSVALLKPNISKVVVSFFYYYLSYKQKQLENIASGSSQKNLLLRQLKSFLIVLPDISEQIQIGGRLSNIDKHIENYLKQKTILEYIKKGLMQQLLTGRIRVKV